MQSSASNANTSAAASQSLPRRVTVGSLLQSRYPEGKRPGNWDLRTPGIDVIKTTSGEELRLWSDGGQPPPQHGWVLMLTGVAEQPGAFTWTLYGMPVGSGLP